MVFVFFRCRFCDGNCRWSSWRYQHIFLDLIRIWTRPSDLDHQVERSHAVAEFHCSTETRAIVQFNDYLLLGHAPILARPQIVRVSLDTYFKGCTLETMMWSRFQTILSNKKVLPLACSVTCSKYWNVVSHHRLTYLFTNRSYRYFSFYRSTRYRACGDKATF